ncbi:hypothetical protein PanWU01x14_235110 [Parasponia andersonii]|uniref:Uncharacterized protein n=1 Tax=Parasponia andersonii TaxID=3476 RepID=A0A2P5BJ54_PARAD|nr:hypothetical protein PanWU01x14_235110 [Parasponia andersonii]
MLKLGHLYNAITTGVRAKVPAGKAAKQEFIDLSGIIEIGQSLHGKLKKNPPSIVLDWKNKAVASV